MKKGFLTVVFGASMVLGPNGASANNAIANNEDEKVIVHGGDHLKTIGADKNAAAPWEIVAGGHRGSIQSLFEGGPDPEQVIAARKDTEVGKKLIAEFGETHVNTILEACKKIKDLDENTINFVFSNTLPWKDANGNPTSIGNLDIKGQYQQNGNDLRLNLGKILDGEEIRIENGEEGFGQRNEYQLYLIGEDPLTSKTFTVKIGSNEFTVEINAEGEMPILNITNQKGGLRTIPTMYIYRDNEKYGSPAVYIPKIGGMIYGWNDSEREIKYKYTLENLDQKVNLPGGVMLPVQPKRPDINTEEAKNFFIEHFTQYGMPDDDNARKNGIRKEYEGYEDKEPRIEDGNANLIGLFKQIRGKDPKEIYFALFNKSTGEEVNVENLDKTENKDLLRGLVGKDENGINFSIILEEDGKVEDDPNATAKDEIQRILNQIPAFKTFDLQNITAQNVSTFKDTTQCNSFMGEITRQIGEITEEKNKVDSTLLVLNGYKEPYASNSDLIKQVSELQGKSKEYEDQGKVLQSLYNEAHKKKLDLQDKLAGEARVQAINDTIQGVSNSLERMQVSHEGKFINIPENATSSQIQDGIKRGTEAYNTFMETTFVNFAIVSDSVKILQTRYRADNVFKTSIDALVKSESDVKERKENCEKQFSEELKSATTAYNTALEQEKKTQQNRDSILVLSNLNGDVSKLTTQTDTISIRYMLNRGNICCGYLQSNGVSNEVIDIWDKNSRPNCNKFLTMVYDEKTAYSNLSQALSLFQTEDGSSLSLEDQTAYITTLHQCKGEFDHVNKDGVYNQEQSNQLSKKFKDCLLIYFSTVKAEVKKLPQVDAINCSNYMKWKDQVALLKACMDSLPEDMKGELGTEFEFVNAVEAKIKDSETQSKILNPKLNENLDSALNALSLEFPCENLDDTVHTIENLGVIRMILQHNADLCEKLNVQPSPIIAQLSEKEGEGQDILKGLKDRDSLKLAYEKILNTDDTGFDLGKLENHAGALKIAYNALNSTEQKEKKSEYEVKKNALETRIKALKEDLSTWDTFITLRSQYTADKKVTYEEAKMIFPRWSKLGSNEQCSSEATACVEAFKGLVTGSRDAIRGIPITDCSGLTSSGDIPEDMSSADIKKILDKYDGKISTMNGAVKDGEAIIKLGKNVYALLKNVPDCKELCEELQKAIEDNNLSKLKEKLEEIQGEYESISDKYKKTQTTEQFKGLLTKCKDHIGGDTTMGSRDFGELQCFMESQSQDMKEFFNPQYQDCKKEYERYLTKTEHQNDTLNLMLGDARRTLIFLQNHSDFGKYSLEDCNNYEKEINLYRDTCVADSACLKIMGNIFFHNKDMKDQVGRELNEALTSIAEYRKSLAARKEAIKKAQEEQEQKEKQEREKNSNDSTITSFQNNIAKVLGWTFDEQWIHRSTINELWNILQSEPDNIQKEVAKDDNYSAFTTLRTDLNTLEGNLDTIRDHFEEFKYYYDGVDSVWNIANSNQFSVQYNLSGSIDLVKTDHPFLWMVTYTNSKGQTVEVGVQDISDLIEKNSLNVDSLCQVYSDSLQFYADELEKIIDDFRMAQQNNDVELAKSVMDAIKNLLGEGREVAITLEDVEDIIKKVENFLKEKAPYLSEDQKTKLTELIDRVKKDGYINAEEGGSTYELWKRISDSSQAIINNGGVSTSTLEVISGESIKVINPGNGPFGLKDIPESWIGYDYDMIADNGVRYPGKIRGSEVYFSLSGTWIMVIKNDQGKTVGKYRFLNL